MPRIKSVPAAALTALQPVRAGAWLLQMESWPPQQQLIGTYNTASMLF